MDENSIKEKFSPASKVWVYQSNRELSHKECEEIALLGNNFIKEWTAHGSRMKAGFEIRYNRFLILVADESLTMASGCSIDASIGFIKFLENRFNVVLLDRMVVAIKSPEGVRSLALHDFEESLRKKVLSADSIVFNNLVQTLGELDSKWEIPVRESWHSRYL